MNRAALSAIMGLAALGGFRLPAPREPKAPEPEHIVASRVAAAEAKRQRKAARRARERGKPATFAIAPPLDASLLGPMSAEYSACVKTSGGAL
jgi:hypothetical protein